MQLDDIVFVPLTQEGKFAIIDREDAERVFRYRWCLSGRYAMRGRRMSDPAGSSTVMLHRSVMDCPAVNVVDHVNMNPLDNRKSNLRCATKSQDAANRNLRKNNTSGYRGVTWDRRYQKWSASIWSGVKNVFLGYYIDPEEAARAYDRALREKVGEFARLNFPEHD